MKRIRMAMVRNILLAAVLALQASLSSVSMAHDCGFTALHGKEAPIRWDFIQAEFEAKFLSDKETLKNMEKMVDSTIEFTMADGSKVRYQVEFLCEHIYEDIYHDTDSLELYGSGGMLRLRSRWDKCGKGDYKHRKSVYQAKSEDKSDGQVANPAFVARNEIPGRAYDYELPKRKRKKLLQVDSEDEAVRFARGMLKDPDERLHKVSSSHQERFFMTLTPIGRAARIAPTFYLSLDKVKFKGLRGEEGTSKHWIVELEAVSKMSGNNPERLRKQLEISSALATHLQNSYALTPADRDKYAMSVENTVLRSGSN